MSPNIFCMQYWPKTKKKKHDIFRPRLLCLRGRRREQRRGCQRRPVCALPVHASLPEAEDRGSDVSSIGRRLGLCHLRTIAESTTLSPMSHSIFSLYFPTGWNLQLEIDPWTIFGWSNGTTSAITCWRASTLTLVSVSQTVETPVSTFMSSPSCLRAWVSHSNQVTLIRKNGLCDLLCLWTGNVITFQLLQHYFLLVASAPPLKIWFMQQLQRKDCIYS